MEERVEKEIDKIGTIRYYNNKRQLHNENGPAIEYKISCSEKQKYKEWWINGILQKCEGWKIYYKKQQLTEYYVHGSLHMVL